VESGTDIPMDTVYRETLLNAGFGTFNTDRYLTTADYKSVRNVASGAPYDHIVVLVNHRGTEVAGFIISMHYRLWMI